MASDTEIPLLYPGQDPPGHWALVEPRHANEKPYRRWVGAPSWRTRHGEAFVIWSIGRISRIENARLATGERISTARVEVSSDFFKNTDVVVRWKSSDGSYMRARPHVSEEDVTLEMLPPREQIEYEEGFERSLSADPDIRTLVLDDEFARQLYASLCNVEWVKGDEHYACSWRYAGDLVASLRGKGEDYMDFYCSGGEGRVSEAVRYCLAQLGYTARELDLEAQIQSLSDRSSHDP